MEQESTFQANLPALKKIAFGSVSPFPIQSSYISLSRSHINSLQLLLQAFVRPNYQQDQIVFADQQSAILNQERNPNEEFNAAVAGSVLVKAISESHKIYF